MRALSSGIRWLADHQQLWFTFVVAFAICASFLFTADRFLRVARDAQETLINVRVGAIQDSFVPLAEVLTDDPQRLRAYMQDIAKLNPTVKEFVIASATSSGWIIGLSINEAIEGESVLGQDFLLSLAKADPSQSFTVEESDGTGRFFRTARSIPNASGKTMVALTRQSLSEADRRLDANMRNSFLVLIAILFAILLLFFRHARIIDYTVLYRRLREVDSLKDDFLSMASHELRAPLTTIRAAAEAAQGSDPAQRAQLLTKIDSSAQELNMLISDMLDVSKIEQGRISLEPENIDTHALLSPLLEDWKAPAAQKGLTLSYELAAGLTIVADPGRTRQIVVNLVSNAVKYTERGEVRIRTSAENGMFTLRVSDSGLGMTEEQRAHLFEKFYRAGSAEVQKQAGTGLGLWITKQLVELMDGHISVESIQGVGSHFIVTFPLASTRS